MQAIRVGKYAHRRAFSIVFPVSARISAKVDQPTKGQADPIDTVRIDAGLDSFFSTNDKSSKDTTMSKVKIESFDAVAATASASKK